MKLAGPLGLVLEPLLALAYNHQNWDVHNHGLKPGFKWHRPFPEDGHDPGGFTVPCKHIEEFHAHQIKMADIREPFPDGLAPWADAVEAFFDPRTYPGGWDGANLKGTNRDLLVMEYKDVPRAVREWIASRQSDLDSDDRWLYAIFEKPKSKTDTIIATVAPSPSATDTELSDKIMVFAPGALYENLPLWVAKGSKCEATFLDLSKYEPQAKDKKVIAWPLFHSKPDKKHHKEMKFSVEAMYVEETHEGRAWRELWERHHISLQRSERKKKREERQAAREKVNQPISHDEL